MLRHRNLVANIAQVQEAFPIYERDVLVGVLPFFHIYGMQVIMNQGLRAGATIVTMPRFDLDQFLSLIAEHGVTRAYVVPPIALALAKHPAIDDADLSLDRDDHVGRGAARRRALREGRRADRLHGDPGLWDDRDEPGDARDPPRRREPRRVDRAAARRHRVPARRPRERRGRRARRARRALDPRPAGDGRLPRERRGDRVDDRRRRLAAHRRHRGRRRRRLLRDRRPAQGADQVQGLPGRAGRARGAGRSTIRRSPTSR